MPREKPLTERKDPDLFIAELEAHPWREKDGRIYLYVRPPHTLFATQAVCFDADGRPYLDRLTASSRDWLMATTPAEKPEGLDIPK